MSRQSIVPPKVRRAVPQDAVGVVGVFEAVVAERVHSAIDREWSADEERKYLESLSPREAVHVAVDHSGRIVGLQTLDRWSSSLTSMAHVGQIGTFLLPQWRGLGLGRALWSATRSFAREVDYRKLVISVRGSNVGAQAFYRKMGFRDCGRLARQVVIDGIEDDEVLLELFL